MKPSQSHIHTIRGLRYHVRTWGDINAPKIFLLHGWMDVSASFQFLVDSFKRDLYVVAPDWRGFGLTESGGADCFWYPDYLADLEALLDHYAPSGPVDLVGHSMGANVAMMYAGVRPERVRRLINLEGFGMPATQPEQAAERFAKWLNELKALHAGKMQLKSYDSLDAVAARLVKTNPRLSSNKARWLASHWSAEVSPGHWQILGEAAHKLINPQLYRVDEVMAVHRQISAPTLVIEAVDDSIAQFWRGKFSRAEHRERLQAVPSLDIVEVPDCGHMLHHDQPEAVAALIERFISA
jgi:pimeloyl-ACP methyl ester carboxylesterase